MTRYQHAIVACARWEAPYLTEWLTYHHSIGFDHFFVYCNDDDPDACHSVLLPFIVGPDPLVTFVHYPFVGVQGQMYKHFLRNSAASTKWFTFLDIDEFCVFRRHGTVGRFIAALSPRADLIFMNWLLFGHNGFEARPEGSVLLNYTRRARRLNAYTKLLVRTEAADLQQIVDEGESGFWHSWDSRNKTLTRATNVLGEDMTGYYSDNFPVDADRFLSDMDRHARSIDCATIYHYQIRSLEDLDRRWARGVSGDFHGQAVFRRISETGKVGEFLDLYFGSRGHDTSGLLDISSRCRAERVGDDATGRTKHRAREARHSKLDQPMVKRRHGGERCERCRERQFLANV